MSVKQGLLEAYGMLDEAVDVVGVHGRVLLCSFPRNG